MVSGIIPLSFRQELIALGASVFVGGLIGVERQSRDKAAGLRTMIFICMGATLFTIISRCLGGDPARVAAQIVSGIGFIGAGVILKHGSRILGVTTAAVIWVTAALGMCIGAGHYSLVLVATPLVLAILWGFRYVTRLIDSVHEERSYHIGMDGSFNTIRIDDLLMENGLICQSRVFERTGTQVCCTMHIACLSKGHEQLLKQLLDDDTIREVRA